MRLWIGLGIFFLFLAPLIAQSDLVDKDLDRLILMEQGRSSSKISFRNNPLMQDYDLKYHRLEWQLDPEQVYIDGQITSYFVVQGNDFQQIHFDLRDNMRITRISYHEMDLTHEHEDNLVRIALPNQIPFGTLDSIRVEYEGAPQKNGFGSFQVTRHGNNEPVLWTLSEPYGAADWWPCKQDLNDKIDSLDIIITVPERYKAGTNGILSQTESLSEDRIRYTWKHRYPIPTYLISLAISNYEEFTDYAFLEDGSSIPILNYVYPEDKAKAEIQLKSTLEQMELFSQLFGDYPYKDEKYGHAQFGFPGGMEHQTMSSMGDFSYGLQAHELAHQWFGNKITCGSWEDIWLNEGFASYLTALCEEFLNPNTDSWENWKKNTIKSITSSPDGSTFVSDTNDIRRIFNGRLSYRKGAIILHMLRWKLGDKDFFQAIRNYINDPALAFNFARTADLQRHLELQSGQDLEEFFADWFYGEGYPSYTIITNLGSRDIQLNLVQSTSHPSVDFYEMPIPLLFSNGLQDTLVIVDHQFSGQHFNISLDFSPNTLVFDPNFWILSGSNELKILPNWQDVIELAINIYPNPTTDRIRIQVDPPEFLDSFGKIRLINHLGQIMSSHPGLPSDQSINLKSYPAGVYFLEYELAGAWYRKRLVKQ